MRVYHIAHELDRPNRAVLQLLRELGFTVASHMARLTPEEEAGLREAVERQSRGAPAVRAAHSSAPSVQASQVAEVVVKLDLDIQTNGEAKDGGLLVEFEGPGKDVRVSNTVVGGAVGTGGRATPEKTDIKTMLVKVNVTGVTVTADYPCAAPK